MTKKINSKSAHRLLSSFAIEDLLPYICEGEKHSISQVLSQKKLGPKSWRGLFDYYYENPSLASGWIKEELHISSFEDLDKELSWKLVSLSLESFLNKKQQKRDEIQPLFEELSKAYDEFCKKFNEVSVKLENNNIEIEQYGMEFCICDNDAEFLMDPNDDFGIILSIGYESWKRNC